MDELKAIASNVPKETWLQLTKTATETFEKIIFPLTATTEGIGQLIQIKFNRLNDCQKIIAAKCIQEVAEKTNPRHQKNKPTIKPIVIYEALDNTDNQTDETIRTLWANLLTKEIEEGSVHPEIAKILSKVTSQDALLLLEITKDEPTSFTIKVLKAMATSWTLGLLNKGKTFNHVHLKNLGLILEQDKSWYITTTGREFLRCVSDPQ